MEILPEPKDVDATVLKFLKALMGENGITFLDLNNAITAVKDGQPVWQAPFAIGLRILPSLYRWERDTQGRAVPTLALLVVALASQIKIEDMTDSDSIGSALESLETQYASLNAGRYKLADEHAHTLFHTRFALGILLLIKGDEERAKTILRQMAATQTTRRDEPWSSEGLGQFDVGETKRLAAIILQDFYEQRQDYEMALYLLTEAIASYGSGPWAESLLAVVPGLLESFAEKCERANDSREWADLFDRAAGLIKICGEADTSGDLPSNCKTSSPQFLAWTFGQLVARFAIRNSASLGDSKKIIPDGYQNHETNGKSIFDWGYGSDWLNGTMVASLLLEYCEHRNWQIMRHQYISMWEALPSYQ
jgi:hypothetical protein